MGNWSRNGADSVCATKTDIPVKRYLQFVTVQYIIYLIIFQLQQKANDFDLKRYFLCK